MVTTKQQFALLYPSIPDALFRRLMMDETVAFLRDDKTIYGFRLTVDDKPLPGLVQIAVSKQHILAYVTSQEVILFPTVEVLGDATYQSIPSKWKRCVCSTISLNLNQFDAEH